MVTSAVLHPSCCRPVLQLLNSNCLICLQASVSVSRLQEFLLLPEVKKSHQVTVTENGVNGETLQTKIASLSALCSKAEYADEVEKQPLTANCSVSVSIEK